MPSEPSAIDWREPINSAPAHVKRIIQRVLALENQRLDEKVPRHINDDILSIVKEEVK